VDDPEYAKAIGVYLDYLLNTRRFSCIRYFILTNEPNSQVRDWDKWKRGARNVLDELRRRGLDKRLTFTASDTCQDGSDESWHRLAVDQMQDVIGVYDIHRYAEIERVRKGNLEDYWRHHRDYALEHDPRAAAKQFLVGEAGMNTDAHHPSGNPRIVTFDYGVFMADYAIQAVRAGWTGMSIWMLSDNCHEGFSWGLWANREEGLRLRPVFQVWALLSRYVPAGSAIYRPAHQPTDVRLLAAQNPQTPKKWTFCMVNRAEEEASVTFKTPGGGKAADFRQYVYAEGMPATDANGFPKHIAGMTANPGQGVTLTCPPNAFTLLTSVR
jgi:hypothetical protein